MDNSFEIEFESSPETKHESTAASQESKPSPQPWNNCCFSVWRYGDIPEAKGYALVAIGRGVAVMSNVVVNAALLELAMDAAGCPRVGELEEMEAEGMIEDADDFECTNKIYGQNPLSLISNIAVATGLISAIVMPIIGVILDFTPYRRLVGMLSSAIFTIIQGVQIGIGPNTWFVMAVLQSIAGVCFSVMIMTSFAYLPEICEKAGAERHSVYTALFTVKQFSFQASFLVLVGALSFGLKINKDSVMTARLSQTMNVGIISMVLGMGWKCLPSRPASRDLHRGNQCLILHGIRQNFRTAGSIYRDYKKGLRWYLLATLFAQSSVGALTTMSVVYLSSEVGLNAADVILFFLVVLIGTTPGAKFATMILKRVDPSTSWQLSMVFLFVTLVIGAFTLGDAPNKYLSLIWGFFVGAMLGWFYPTENLFFSCILPKGQEAEIAGFRVYCSMILAWLPPMVFSVLVENGFDANWGLTLMGSFILVSASILRFGAGSWKEILEESQRSGSSEHEEHEAEAIAEVPL